MAPMKISDSAQFDHVDSRIFAKNAEDEICITGMAGSFPSSRNVAEFEHNLWNKIDMVTEENSRWPHYHPEIPKRMGNICDIDKFDAQFFGVHYKQAETLDPQGRLLQERAYEAITDAGVHPRLLRGSRTGVFIGACYAESEKTIFYDKFSERGFGITGCLRSMLANRISYSLGLQGPSMLVDTACSSSIYALDMAFNFIQSGKCDAAIVGGSNLLLQPGISLQYARLGVLSQDGCCRTFDKDASGYVRSEAVAVIFLQKAKQSKRVYAKLLYTKTNCDGHKEQGITFPSGIIQQNLLTEFYSDLRIDPTTVNYVEAHGTGTVAGDPEECGSLDNAMCRNRIDPLLVGSVKSNMGHSESTSGMCSITKVLLAFERGEMPPNIHYASIRPDIPSIVQKRIKVCTDFTKLPENALVGINSFGVGGANAHALIRGNQKTKFNGGRPDDDVPRLVNWSGRTEKSISVMVDYLGSVPLDAEYIGLLQNIQSVEEPGFLQRGFGVFAKAESNTDPAICLSSGEQRFDGVKRPLVWIFSGMGSQWPEMGSSLMVLPVFKDSITKSGLILKPFGIDLIHIITSPDKMVFDNILNSFVGIAAIQIALVDVLNALNIRPDYLIGHSVGELGCAYADGVLNQEHMILTAYYRGLASAKADLIRGSMAAVGIGYSELKAMLPADIDAACHNSADSSTISGPEESVTDFVAKLKSQNIFAKPVMTSNIAYHSRYVAEIGKILLELTKDLYQPVRRSDKWLSTSVPQNEWNQPENIMCNAEYYANNLLGSVFFEETCALLPSNAIAIEIAPHGLLQAIVKRSMPTTIHIPLTQRGNLNNAAFFLNALGRLFLNGWTMPLEKLYPPITYPVSRGTAKISPFIRWDHSVSFFVSKFESNTNPESGEHCFTINLTNTELTYLAGHQIDGRCLFPATGYLELVWKSLAMMKDTEQALFNVEFDDVQFLRATPLKRDTDIELKVMINYGNGSFEVSQGSISVVTGFIREVNDNDAKLTELPPVENSTYPMLNQEDFYKEMRLRGYQFKDDFQSVITVRSDGAHSTVRWNNNWVSFMDCILQTKMLSNESRSLMLPIRIQSVKIFPKEHFKRINMLQSIKNIFEINCNDDLDIVQTCGVEIVGLESRAVSRRKAVGNLALESYMFIQHKPSAVLSQQEAYRICIQLMIENNPGLHRFKVLEVFVSPPNAEQVVSLFHELFSEIPLVKAQLTLLTDRNVELPNVTVVKTSISVQTNCHLITLSDASLLSSCQESLVNQGFIIFRNSNVLQSNDLSAIGLNIIAEIQTESETVYLLRKRVTINQIRHVIDISNSKDFNWIDKVKQSVKTTSILLLSQNNPFSGIIGLVNCIKLEPNFKSVSCFFIDDMDAPQFDPTEQLYADQLELNLAINVYRHGAWGSYRHLKLVQEKEIKPRDNHYYINVLRHGDLSSLTWLEGPLCHQTNNQLVRIQYAAINFKDVMLSTGRLSTDVFHISRVDKESMLGFEYAGTTLQGQRVMGMVALGAMSTLVQPFGPLTWKVPKEWSLQEAATVSLVYATVYYAFFIGKTISAGKSILIHAGSGGVGLAAIRVALAYNMEVFTTVSNETKKQYILGLFPKLKESNIGNSRDCSFEQMIKLRTRGKGVDFVLNSLSEEKLKASVRCLGRAGVFLEIGKFDLSNDTKVGLGVFLKEMSFRSVLLDQLFQHPEETCYLHGLIERDLKIGIIQPLRSTVFQVDEIERAYRYLSTAQHIGKVLIQVRRDEQDEFSVPISAFPRAYFDADKVYIIPGGLGGFGLELADWMVLRGARKIVLSSSRGLSNSYQAYRRRIWVNYGCQTFISTADISKPAGSKALIMEALQYGQIDGIFNLAVCLRDEIFENQNAESFQQCSAPKSDATIHLDDLTRQMGINLTYFVVFSSISCGRGNAGQSNYGLTNSVMERIIEKRVSDGLSGKAIQWGAIGEVGLVAEMSTNNLEAEVAGTVVQRISSCLQELDILLTTPDPIVGSMFVAKKKDSATFRKKTSLIEMVLNIMSVQSMKTISMTTTLSDLGMDSLMTIEIKQALELEFEINISSKDLRAMTFQMLQTLSDAGGADASSLIVPKSDTDLKELFNLKYILMEEKIKNREPIYRLMSKTDETSFDGLALIFPGAEGDTSPVWQFVCKQLNVPTYIAHYRTTMNESTVSRIAQIYAKFYLESLPRLKKFLVIGFSFGTLVAIEVVRILETSGLHVHLVCIDGSPALVKRLVLKLINADHFTNHQQLQKAILNNIASSCLPKVILKTFNERLDLLDEWQTKIQALIDFFAESDYNINGKSLVEAVNGFYNRVLSSLLYPISERIQSNITLIRATEATITDIEENLELNSHTEGTVTLKYVKGHHQSILERSSTTYIINQLLINLK